MSAPEILTPLALPPPLPLPWAGRTGRRRKACDRRGLRHWVRQRRLSCCCGRRSGRYGEQLEDASVLCCRGDVTFAEGNAHRIKLLCVLNREIGRPATLVLDEVDGNLGRVFSLTNELEGPSTHRCFRFERRTHSAGTVAASSSSVGGAAGRTGRSRKAGVCSPKLTMVSPGLCGGCASWSCRGLPCSCAGAAV